MRVRGWIRIPHSAWAPLSVVLVLGCGPETAAPPPISVSVDPPNASLLAGGVQDFTATVANDPGTQGVLWSITGCAGGAAACGSLTNVTNTTATYTAPAAAPPAAVGITATSVADNTKSFTASMTIVTVNSAGRIAFKSHRDGNSEIYVMNENGSGQVNLTNNPGGDYSPAWAPDGSRIAFVSDRDGNQEIYLMNADGSQPVNVSTNAAGDGGPVWSADGTKIAFVSDRDGNQEIYLMNADGSQPVNVSTNAAGDYGPVWSADGTKIAFVSDRDGNWEIYVVNVDGSGLVNLTNRPDNDYAPAWSPDGTRIAFFSSGGVYLMNADGSGITQLTGASGIAPLSWSPDGHRIAFTNGGVAVVNADGSGFDQLVADYSGPCPGVGRTSYGPVWSPSGLAIAFSWTSTTYKVEYYMYVPRLGRRVPVCSRSYGWGISVIPQDGNGLMALAADASSPAWSPR